MIGSADDTNGKTKSATNRDLDALIGSILGSVRLIIEGMQELGLLHGDDIDDLVDRSRRYLRASLRALSEEEIDRYSDTVLARRLFVKVVQLLYPASIECVERRSLVQHQLPVGSAFQFLMHDQPKYQVGGDLARVDEAADGSVLVLLADVSGKSVGAYITAATVEAAWDRCRETGRTESPLMTLRWLEAELVDCLPDGIFVETVIARVKICGDVELAAAGYIQFLTGSIPRVEDITLGGAYLGAGMTDQFSERTQSLEPNHELVLATDGVFEQPDGKTLLRDTLCGHVINSGQNSIHNAVLEVVGMALKQNPQRDDLTIISLRRLSEPDR